MVQFFKGDALEKQMIAVGETPIALTGAALDDMYAECYESAQFILMLYDEGRMPFSERIKREVFVDFIKQILNRFPFTGTFDSYLFVLYQIFGMLSTTTFTVPSPGKLGIAVNAAANIEFDAVVRTFEDGAFVTSELITDEFEKLIFIGISGINTEYELTLLFSEIMPAGITPDITLTFFVISDFVAEIFGDPDLYDMITTDDEVQIVFVELGV